MQLLLERIQYNNDQKAFQQIYYLLYNKLYHFSFSYTRSKQSAEEIVNDVFLSLWQKREELGSIRNIHVYLYVAVKNASLNFLRRNKITEPVSIDDLSVAHLSFRMNPEIACLDKELSVKVHKAIDQLPSRCRLIYKLVKEDGLSYKEVSEILQVSVKTIDSQLCIAIKKLAAILRPVSV